MKVFFVTLLAIVIVPLIFTFFQNAKYERDLKPSLLSQARELVSSSGLKNGEVHMEKLDLTVSGVAGSKEVAEELKKAIAALDGAVRVKAVGGAVSVYGEMNFQKVGGDLRLAGKMRNASAFVDKLNATDVRSLGKVMVSSELQGGEVFRDSTVIENTQLPEWSAKYLALSGDRGYKVSSRDNVIRPYGKVTPGLKKMFTESAKGMGLKLDPASFTLVDGERAHFNLTNTGGKKSISGKGPTSVDLASLFSADENELKTEDFVDAHSSVVSPKFQKWVRSYFRAEGDRGIKVDHDEVTLSGPATTSQETQWLDDLSNQGLKPISKLTVDRSEVQESDGEELSKLDEKMQESLLNAFALNQVFFDSSSSKVREDQQPKIAALATAIAAAGKDVSFVIGGHADASGNVEFNKQLSKKRAASVVAALAKKGISSKKFSVVSFGAAKASSAVNKKSARKVEIRIK